MSPFFRNRWIFFVASALLVGVVGVFFGHWQRKTDVRALYKRTDFTLIDSKQGFFHLHDLKENEFLLVLYTPDELKQQDVAPLKDLYLGYKQNAQKELKIAIISKVGKDLVRNFLNAAQISDAFLVDPSGSVRDLIGLPMGREFWNEWGIAVIDRNLQVVWLQSQKNLISFDELKKQLVLALDRPTK